MSLAKLEEHLLDQAKDTISGIREKYGQQAAAEEKRIQEAARQLEETILVEAERTADLEAKRLHQQAQLQAKTAILAAKQAAIAETKQQVHQAILAWEADKRDALLKALLETIGDSAGEVIAGEKHQAALKKLIGTKELQLADETVPGEGGFVFKGEESEYNLTVGFLVDRLMARQRAEIARVLFG